MDLKNEVKRALRILDDNNDEIIEDIIFRGKANLNNLVGVELDFDKQGLARKLLIDYCRYDFHNASEYFEENFLKELNRLILQIGAKSYEEK